MKYSAIENQNLYHIQYSHFTKLCWKHNSHDASVEFLWDLPTLTYWSLLENFSEKISQSDFPLDWGPLFQDGLGWQTSSGGP